MNLDKCLKILSQPYEKWNDLESILYGIGNSKEKGNVFEVFTKFLLILRKEQYQLTEVYLRYEIPENIQLKLNLYSSDHGVDGVAVKDNGELIAFQSKFRSDRGTLQYRELSTFHSESEHADYRLVISNATAIAKSANKPNQIQILAEELELLEEVFFGELHKMLDGEIISKNWLIPRDYQVKIINQVINEFSNKDRGKVIAACGTGKTLLAKWIHDELDSKCTLYLVPSLALIKQTIEEWFNKTEKKFSFIVVCSDKTVVKEIDSYDIFEEEFTNFPVTTNLDEISEFLAQETKKVKVIFSTYQSVDVIVNSLKALKLQDFKFDLAICDEAHHTAGIKNSKMFLYVLEDQYIRVRKRLFLTATEKVVTYGLKKKLSQSPWTVSSMDDVEKYGETISNLNFGEAIKKGIISDYRIVVCGVKEEEISDLIIENKNLQLEILGESKVTTVDDVLKKIILSKVIKELDVRKIITYHSNIKQAELFIKGTSVSLSLRDVILSLNSNLKDNEVILDHVNGKMSAVYRNRILNSFQNADYGIVSNARCLTEGIDVPEIDAVYFADHKSSTIDIIQAVGRVLRKKEGKDKIGYIIIPVIIPFGEQNFSGINSEVFETLYEVIQALREQDSELAEIIDELNYEISTGGSVKRKKKGMKKKLKVILPDKVDLNEFELGLQLRIGEVDNRLKKNQFRKIENRRSNIDRFFVTMGDCQAESYWNSLVRPMLEKFDSDDELKNYTEIKINHNSPSHQIRIGIIDRNINGSFELTTVGKYLKNNPNKFTEVFKEQMLRYSIYNESQKIFIFPYRAWLKILKEVKFVRKIDFIYCIYLLRDTNDLALKEAINNIKYMHENYKNPNLLNDKNREKVTKELNEKFNVDFSFQDIWFSKTTTSNQFNYFKNHLQKFDDIISYSQKDDSLLLIPGLESRIDDILSKTEEFEKCNDINEMRSIYVNIDYEKLFFS